MTIVRSRLAVLVVLAMLSTAGPAWSGPRPSKAHPMLTSLHEERAAHAAVSRERFVSRNELLRVVDDHVLVNAVADDDVGGLEAALVALGMRNAAVFGRIVSGELPVDAIPALEAIPSLRLARPAIALRSAGAVTSQGDFAMRADAARGAFGLSGAGVKVGVLSDSFNCLGGAAADVNSGDLSPVSVLQEISSCSGATDEGRGMLQIVHDVAPGATLLFASAFNGEASFAQNIIALKNAGARVIVDDIIYFDEPMFQDGIIAQAADTVVAQGTSYFSAVTNYARQSYESVFRPGSTFADGAFLPAPGAPSDTHFAGGRAHNFSPSGTDHMQQIVIPSGRTFNISLQWDSPFFSVSGAPGSRNDVDVYLLNASNQVVASASTNNLGGDAIELLSFRNAGATATFKLMILNYAGPQPGFIKYNSFNAGITIASFATNSGPAFGHPAAFGAEAVGAAYYQKTPVYGTYPPQLEPFSSSGPTRILFNTAGQRLSSPEVRLKPNLVAPDGGNTTFFGDDSDGDGWPNFFGSSAAAPHAAAVAALMLQRNPGLDPFTIYAIQEGTALDMGAPGIDDDTGNGLLQADAALEALSSPQIALAVGLSRHNVSPGNTVQISVAVRNTGTTSLQDVYFVMFPPVNLSPALGCPGGDAVVFFANAFANVLVRCVASAPPQALAPLLRDVAIPGPSLSVTIPNFVSFVWPSGLPAGLYTFGLFTTPPWAFFNRTGVSASAADTLTASP
jgi:Subtilase family